MTRSHKFGDRVHEGNTEGVDRIENDHLPKWFAKSGHADADPTKTKKNGGGKGNWGRDGDELEDFDVNMANPRRRSNSSTHAHDLKHFKTKFETIEPEPVFEEELHGAPAIEGETLEKASTSSSADNVSVDEEEGAHKQS